MFQRKKNSRVPRTADYKGFTLLEMLVAITILSFLALGLIGSFISGMKIWKRVSSIGSNYSHNLILLEKICRELRESANLPLIGFEGNASQISFPRLENNNAILKISYKFDADKKALFRRTVDLKDVIAKKEEDNYTEKRLLSLEEFSLQYLYFDSQQQCYIWNDTWIKDKGVFSAVRIQMKVKNDEFIKTIFIPIF